MSTTYQLLWLGKPGSSWRASLDDAMRRGLKALGLEPDEVYALFDATAGVDWRFPVACVWAAEVGDDSSSRLGLLREVMEHGAPVFPVLADLSRYTAIMPKDLHPINGMEWSRGEDRLASDILKAFGLSRSIRSVFISYMRRHSSDAAHQLLHKLTDHGYRPFLDTASVEFADTFQESLWDSMANVDFLLFLDTPDALSSTWVEQELTRAHNLGMATLRLRWPGWKGAPGTDLSTTFNLEASDFEQDAPALGADGRPNPNGRIAQDVLEKIAKTCEQVRMRSIGSRRARIVGELMRRLPQRKLTAVADYRGGVVILRADTVAGLVLPIVGFPDSPHLFEHRTNFGGPPVNAAMLYDGLGIKPQRVDYLTWLNQELKGFRSVPMTEINSWLNSL